jgi:hypothetical protein
MGLHGLLTGIASLHIFLRATRDHVMPHFNIMLPFKCPWFMSCFCSHVIALTYLKVKNN